MSQTTELDFAKELAYEAGKIMSRYFRAEDIGTIAKKDNTPVTIADLKINDLVIEKVRKMFPEHGILGEEKSYKEDRDLIWVVDPIDGTIPFTLGMPISTFSIALVDRIDGQPTVAVTYDPYMDHLYSAVKGKGAYLNNTKIHTSKSTSFINECVSIHGPTVRSEKRSYFPGKVIDLVRDEDGRNINLPSGIYLANKIASGEMLCSVFGPGYVWDVASIALLVKEAGGIVTDMDGNKRRYDINGLTSVMSANKTIHQKMLNILEAL